MKVTLPDLQKILKQKRFTISLSKADQFVLMQLVCGILLGLCVLLSGVTAFFFHQYQKLRKDPQLSVLSANAVPDTSKSALETISEDMVLPNEEPVSATVSNKLALPDNPLYAKAENGDKIFIFKTAHKAILFRPSLNKIIDVQPADFEEPAPTDAPSDENAPQTQRRVLVEPQN